MDNRSGDQVRFDSIVDEIHALRVAMTDLRDAILERIDTAYVRKETHALELRSMNERLTELSREIGGLKAGRNWLVGIVMAAVLVAVLSLVVKGAG